MSSFLVSLLNKQKTYLGFHVLKDQSELLRISFRSQTEWNLSLEGRKTQLGSTIVTYVLLSAR
jgi:hypothetical protein